MQPSPQTVFFARGLTKTYRMGEVEVPALRALDLEIYQGEFVVLLGAVGQRQIDPAQHPRRAGHAHQRRGVLARPQPGHRRRARADRATGASTSASCSSSTT